MYIKQEIREMVYLRSVLKISPSRWLLLFGIGLTYFLGAKWGQGSRDHNSVGSILPFTLLMAVYAILHLIGLAQPVYRRWHMVYFVSQGLLSMAISLFSSNPIGVLMGLFFFLIGEAVVILPRRHLLMVIAIYLTLFGLGLLFQNSWQALFLILRNPLLFLLPSLLFVIVYVQAHAQERSRTLLRQLEAAHNEVTAYAKRVQELTLTAERQRLARELHDTLAQGLAGMVLQLEVVDAHLTKQNSRRAQELVQQTMGRARETLAEARHAIDGLRSTLLYTEDLVEILQEEIQRFTTATSIPCSAALEPLLTLPEIVSEHILRVITESLANIARHARAYHVWIQVSQREDRVCVEVKDDGIGFEPATTEYRPGHYGLLGLRERARLTGGSLEVLSAPRQGTIIRFSLPYPRGAEKV